tara:strand:+ start:195 stop:434 length:240 start_codon:yes stop_codon:yes gene_type:complete
MYLIFTTQEDAIARADQEGQLRGYGYWTANEVTRWHTEPYRTAEENWALDVTEYTLTSEEQSQTVSSYNYPSEEDEEEE